MSESSPTGQPMVRAIFRAIPAPAVNGQPAHGSMYCKVYYPALYGGTALEKNTGALPPDSANGPYPVAVLMPGINVSPESYGWLATALTQAGFITAIYGWIVEEMPGMVALSPGLDISALAPDAYATRPSANALGSVLGELEKLNSAGPLAGQLDLDRILLGGHSAGGSTALFNARPDWFPGLRANFAFGAHSKASTMLGYPADTVLALPGQLPTLLLGGSEDGVIAASGFRYGDDGVNTPDPIGPLERTFHEGLKRDRGDSHLAIIRGANHFSACWPADPATGRPFLDWPTTRPDADIQRDIAELVVKFAQTHMAPSGDDTAQGKFLALLGDSNRISLHATR